MWRSLPAAVATLAVCCAVIAMVPRLCGDGGNERETVAKAPELPLLRFTEELLRRDEFRPPPMRRQRSALGALRWVEHLHWCGDRQVLAASAWPSHDDYESMRFTTLEATGSTALGTWPILMFHARHRRFVPINNAWWMAVSERGGTRTEACIRFDLGLGESTTSSPPASLAGEPMWVRVGGRAGSDSLVGTGPMTIYDSRGRLLAAAALPEAAFPVDQRDIPFRASGNAFEVLVRTLPSLELAGHDDPPGGITLLRVPRGTDGLGEILRAFSQPGIALPEPVSSAGMTHHGLDSPALASGGTHAAFREKLMVVLRAEQMLVLRLWVWHRGPDRLVLADSVGQYIGPGHSYRLTPAQDGSEVREEYWDFDCWDEYPELMPALSPSGDKIAYRSGNDLVIAEVPLP